MRNTKSTSEFVMILVLVISFLCCGVAFSQSTILLPDELVEEIIAETSGEIALNNELLIAPFERNRPESEYTGLFLETEFMLEKLKAYGFSDVHVEKWETGGSQWDAVKGRLTIVSPFKEKIADHDEIAAMLSRNSGNANVTTDLVYVPNAGNADSYEGIDVAGKVVISEGSLGSIFRTAVNRFNAAGAVAFDTRYPERHPNMVPWNSVRASEGKEAFGFNIYHTKGVELVSRLKRGEKISVYAEVEVKMYPAKMEVVTGLIPGTDRTDQELLLVAHLFEGISKQGGNDNYSGSVCILEAGRTILELIKRGAMEQPRRSIRFLWVPEISGTRAYIRRFPDEIGKMIAGLNMDMVGEDLVKTRSYFHISRTAYSMPSFFNDIVQEFAELTVRMNNDAHNETYGRFNLKITSPNGSQMPFLLNIMGLDTGSDHLVLSNGNVKVPTVYFECWPDDFYHTSMDTPDKTDPTQLKRVAFIAASSIITAAKASTADAPTLVSLIGGKARQRIAATGKAVHNLLAAVTADELPAAYKKAHLMIEGAFLHEIENIGTLELVAEGDRNVIRNIQVEINNLNNEKDASLQSLDDRYGFLCETFGLPRTIPALTREENRMRGLIPDKKAKGIIEEMDTRLNHGLPRSHAIFRVRHATSELANFINGRRTIYEIACMMMAELGGPDPAAVGEYYEALQENGSIVLKQK